MTARRVRGWATAIDACTEYRLSAPFDTLNEQPDDWYCEWQTHPPADLNSWDVLVGARLAGAQPEWLRACADPDVLCVYDMDDDLLAIDPANAVPHSIYAPLADETAMNVTAADLVTVASEYVAERMHQLNPNVHILPICIRDELVRPPVDYGDRPLTLGWGGVFFHQQDWQEACPRLIEVGQQAPEVWMHWMGANYCPAAMPGRSRETGYQPWRQYMEQLDFDIGLCPLGRSAHNRGKAWTKPLELGARGIPFVGTRWGQYERWLDTGANGGLLVDERHDDDWATYLLELIRDPDMRRTYAWNNYQAAQQWSIRGNVGLWQKAYSDA